MACPQISTFWHPLLQPQPQPSSALRHTTSMNTIDITQLGAPPLSSTDGASIRGADLEHLLRARLQRDAAAAFFGGGPRPADLRALAAREREPSIIDSFAPRRKTHDLSPTSSTSHGSRTSGSGSAGSSAESLSASSSAWSGCSSGGSPVTVGLEAQQQGAAAFFATRSRVIRLSNLPALAEAFLGEVFERQNGVQRVPVPATMWELRGRGGGEGRSVWAVFRTHEEASAALLSPALPALPALESDLEPFHNLARVIPSIPMPDTEYTLSSNPPNPKASFRQGDWICPSTGCAAHNFGRNLACIGCGCPRVTSSSSSLSSPPQQQQYHSAPQNTRAAPSPRFSLASAQANPNASVTYYSTQPTPAPTFNAAAHQSQQQQAHQAALTQQQHNLTLQRPTIGFSQPQQQSPFSGASTSSNSPLPHITIGHPTPSLNATSNTSSAQLGAPSILGSSQPQPQGLLPSKPPTSSGSAHPHPLLTPSGRAFAVGGKVQNVSRDPLSPCVMYWPDNEPLPDPGQIRPNNLVGVAPPILNTGNRGPISHQPGDWVCQKCNYLNWRRRKVCQTCLPYAEGNGDSISAAVQAERIALLTSVLSQTQLPRPGPSPGIGLGIGRPRSANPASTSNLNLALPLTGLDAPHVYHQAVPNINLPIYSASPAHHDSSNNGVVLRAHSHTPPHARRPFVDLSALAGALPASGSAPALAGLHPGMGMNNGMGTLRGVHRSQSHFALGQQYAMGGGSGMGGMDEQAHTQQARYTASSPIYQTSGHAQQHQDPRQPSPLYSTGPDVYQAARGGGNVNASNASPNDISNANDIAGFAAPSKASSLGIFNIPNPNITGVHRTHTQTFPGALPAPAPLLPSFLQDMVQSADMVQSPALSPTSTTTSSAELSSVEEYEEQLLAAGAGLGRARGGLGQHPQGQGQGQGHPFHQHEQQQQQQGLFPRARGDSGSSVADSLGIALGAGPGAGVGSSGTISAGAGVGVIGAGAGPLPLGNIWRLDGEESKSLSAFPLPNHHELVGGRRPSREGLRGVV